jgi:hypothetical protein
MAYVLSLRPHSPLKRSFSDNPYLQSCSPLKDSLLAQLGDVTACNTSACSLYSLNSNRAGSWACGNENTPPLTSQSLLSLVPDEHTSAFGAVHIDRGPRKRTYGINRPLPTITRGTAPSNPYSRRNRQAQHVTEPPFTSDSSHSPHGSINADHVHLEEADTFDLYEATHVPLPTCRRVSDNTDSEPHARRNQAPLTMACQPQPFRRWLSTLRRRHIHRQKKHTSERSQLSFEFESQDSDELPLSSRHQESQHRISESMSSSMGCITAIKSASVTVASTSIAPRSDNGCHTQCRIGNRSSHHSDIRRSLDSHRGPLGPIVDERAWLRSLQRRKIVEELIASEEGYIADLKVLVNVRQPHR